MVKKISKEKKGMIKNWLQLRYPELTCPFLEKKRDMWGGFNASSRKVSDTFHDTYCQGTCRVMFPEVIKLVKARANKDGYPKASCPCFHLPVRTVIKRAKALIGKD